VPDLTQSVPDLGSAGQGMVTRQLARADLGSAGQGMVTRAVLLYYGLVNCDEYDRGFIYVQGRSTGAAINITFTLRHYHFVRYGIEDLTRPHCQER